MRISSITNYSMTNNAVRRNYAKKSTNITNGLTQQNEPNFKGSCVGKVAGFILGAIAITVIAPPIGMAGLAGLGAIPGMIAGDAVDKAIDKNNGESSDY